MNSPTKTPKRQAKLSGANPLPFSPLPRDLLRDPELKPIDKVIAGLIMPWLVLRPSGFVFNGVLAKEACIDRRSVPRSLKRLEATLWFRCDPEFGAKSQRKITALWRTKNGLKAIKARIHQLKEAQTHDTDAMGGMTSVSPKEEAMRKKNTKEQRFDLGAKPEKRNAACVEIENVGMRGSKESRKSLMVREAVEIAGDLYQMPEGSNGDLARRNPEAIPLVDRLGEIHRVLLKDKKKNLGYLYCVGWSVHGKELMPSEVDTGLRETMDSVTRGGVERAGAIFCAKMRDKCRIIGEYGGMPVDYADILGHSEAETN